VNEGTRLGKSTIRLLGISAVRLTNGLFKLHYLLNTFPFFWSAGFVVSYYCCMVAVVRDFMIETQFMCE
jgi:hypothetical protein